LGRRGDMGRRRAGKSVEANRFDSLSPWVSKPSLPLCVEPCFEFRTHLDASRPEAHVHQLCVADDRDAAAVDRMDHKLAVHVRVPAWRGDREGGAEEVSERWQRRAREGWRK
jgi:hypothetical protein